MNEISLLPSPGHLANPITRMLRRIQDSLHNAYGKAPTYQEIAEWTGVPEGTVKYWFANQGQPTAQFLVHLLERACEKTRHAILDAGCRVCPTLEHPRLDVEATIISRLKSIISEPCGLVAIQGGTDESRTFLLTALGHTYLGLAERPRGVVGFDPHNPDWFVPVPGVRYLPNVFSQELLRNAVCDAWPESRPGTRTLFLLNSIWSAVPDYERRIRAYTPQFPVVLAEAGLVKPSLFKKMSKGPIHIVTIAKDADNAKRLALTISDL